MKYVVEFNEELALAYVLNEAEGESATQKQKFEAWAFLIKNGKVWTMSRSMKELAMSIIDNGIISTEGEINWDVYDELH